MCEPKDNCERCQFYMYCQYLTFSVCEFDSVSSYINNETVLDGKAYDLFGEMREETLAEQNSIDKYIEKISVESCRNFISNCETNREEEDRNKNK